MFSASSTREWSATMMGPNGALASGPGLEWAWSEEDLVLVASAERAWLHRPSPGPAADPFSDPMTGEGAVETMRNLLDAAVAIPRVRFAEVETAPLTLAQYTWQLVAGYHSTHATPRFMRAAEARFQAAGRDDLAAIARWEVKNEVGHDELALRDLEALGYSRSAVVRTEIPVATAAVVGYADRCVEGEHPVMVLGHAYAMERTAICNTREAVQAVEALLPPGARATRCLRVHSAIGVDVRHVSGLLEKVVPLPAEDRALIVRAAYEAATILYSRPVPAVSEETLRQLLAS